jgi:hypothetical protein
LILSVGAFQPSNTRRHIRQPPAAACAFCTAEADNAEADSIVADSGVADIAEADGADESEAEIPVKLLKYGQRCDKVAASQLSPCHYLLLAVESYSISVFLICLAEI